MPVSYFGLAAPLHYRVFKRVSAIRLSSNSQVILPTAFQPSKLNLVILCFNKNQLIREVPLWYKLALRIRDEKIRFHATDAIKRGAKGAVSGAQQGGEGREEGVKTVDDAKSPAKNTAPPPRHPSQALHDICEDHRQGTQEKSFTEKGSGFPDKDNNRSSSSSLSQHPIISELDALVNIQFVFVCNKDIFGMINHQCDRSYHYPPMGHEFTHKCYKYFMSLLRSPWAIISRSPSHKVQQYYLTRVSQMLEFYVYNQAMRPYAGLSDQTQLPSTHDASKSPYPPSGRSSSSENPTAQVSHHNNTHLNSTSHKPAAHMHDPSDHTHTDDRTVKNEDSVITTLAYTEFEKHLLANAYVVFDAHTNFFQLEPPVKLLYHKTNIPSAFHGATGEASGKDEKDEFCDRETKSKDGARGEREDDGSTYSSSSADPTSSTESSSSANSTSSTTSDGERVNWGDRRRFDINGEEIGQWEMVPQPKFETISIAQLGAPDGSPPPLPSNSGMCLPDAQRSYMLLLDDTGRCHWSHNGALGVEREFEDFRGWHSGKKRRLNLKYVPGGIKGLANRQKGQRGVQGTVGRLGGAIYDQSKVSVRREALEAIRELKEKLNLSKEMR
eukprot:GHVN01010731.1.p1 GENE.GHVN01010731.1~~GHVN01010731.1.p1  ORF type:complete len:611 (+),score=99.57 GHVN01010731.1:105-1937(+)